MSAILAARTFDIADQEAFAAVSGDWNPIHVDPVAARRVVAGEVVVHGVHTLLWALDAHLAASAGEGTSGVAATFLRPVLLGRDVTVTRSREDGWWLEVRQDGETVATIRLRSDAPFPQPLPGLHGADDLPPKDAPRVCSFTDLKGAQGEIAVSTQGVEEMFPHACAVLGSARTAAIIALSRLVGMEAPGANSLFAGLDLGLQPGGSDTLHWRVARHTSPQAPIVIDVDGPGVAGTVTAFVRPAPTAQATMEEVRATVGRDEWAGQRALIVGGSRGLGELVAKAVAAGGGHAIITFNRGEAEARKVAAEIQAAGGSCQIRPYDVDSDDPAQTAAIFEDAPTHLYYFASPRIAASPRGRFDGGKAAKYQSAYVTAFARLCLSAPAGLKVFYPSTTFVDEQPPGFMEYTAAKAAGEVVCAMLNRQISGLHILSIRLPRLKTDQTASFIGKPAQEPLSLMVQIIRQLDLSDGDPN